MKSFTSVVTLLALAASMVAANPLPEANIEGASLEKRADSYFTFWTEIDFKGTKSNIKNPPSNRCFDLSAPFQDSISSAGPTQGLTCTLYENYGCSGRSVTLSYPGSSDLRTVNFNDIASSYACR